VSEFAEQDADLQHFFAQHLITNPRAISGNPSTPQHPQQAAQAVVVHLENKAELSKKEPITKQTRSLNANK